MNVRDTRQQHVKTQVYKKGCLHDRNFQINTHKYLNSPLSVVLCFCSGLREHEKILIDNIKLNLLLEQKKQFIGNKVA